MKMLKTEASFAMATIDAVGEANQPEMTSSDTECGSKRDITIIRTHDCSDRDRKRPDNEIESIKSENVVPIKCIVDLLDRQIRNCASALEQQHARQLAVNKKPITKSTSGIFKSVIDELNVETVAAAAASRLTSLSVEDGCDSVCVDGASSSSQSRGDVERNEVDDIEVRRRLGSFGRKKTSDVQYDNHTPLTPKKYRSSPMCRRTLYEKYLEHHEVWADGLTAAGKQALVEVQRRKVYMRLPHRAQTAPTGGFRTAAAAALHRPATASVRFTSINDTH